MRFRKHNEQLNSRYTPLPKLYSFGIHNISAHDFRTNLTFQFLLPPILLSLHRDFTQASQAPEDLLPPPIPTTPPPNSWQPYTSYNIRDCTVTKTGSLPSGETSNDTEHAFDRPEVEARTAKVSLAIFLKSGNDG